MVKYVSSPGSAYEVAVGVTAEEAAELGLVVVEQIYNGTVPSPVYGRYKDAPSGLALGVTVSDDVKTKVVGAGGLTGTAAPATDSVAAAEGSKGNFINPNDPVIHGGTGKDSVHKDGASPPSLDPATDLRDQVDAAVEANKTAAKKK